MNIAQFSVHRPIFTIMVVLIVVILGGVSLLRLPIDLMPDISYPTISISCDYENAAPEEIEELITRPIEQAMSAVPGVEELTSTSVEGRGNVRVTFTWGTDLDTAANDIRDRLDRVIRRLPEEADRPSLRKFDLATFPILILGASSRLDPVQTRLILEDQVKYRLERVPGVAAVDIWGGLEREIHVSLDPAKINALAIPLDQIISQIHESNVNIPAGTIEKGNYEITIRTPGQYTDLRQLQDTVIAVRQGAPVQLKEIALVEDSWQRITRIVRVNGEPGIRMAVSKQSGKNTVDVARGALAELERINRDIPQIRIVPIIDTSQYIKNSIRNVGTSALYGSLLAVVILLLFLRNIRSTAIIATGIPISIIATFALLYFNKLTLNIMTLGGLALGIGMLVDNAIVVLENIFRIHENGEPIERAAVNGAKEVAAAVIASTLTTVVVFLPLVFMRGMSGVMFKQLSIVIAFSLMCSLAVALTVVPMLCTKILRSRPSTATSRQTLNRRLYEASGRLLTGMENSYRNLLHSALKHRALVVISAVAVLAATAFLARYLGAELMPSTDEGEVRVEVEMEVGTRLDLLDRQFLIIEKIIAENVPEMRNVVANVGGARWYGGGGHTGDIRIALVSQAERTRSSQEIADDLRTKLSGIPGATVRTRAGQGLFVMRMGTTEANKVVVEIRGHDFQTADLMAQRVQEIVTTVPGIADTQISRDPGGPEEQIIIDRQKAADMHLTVSRIANALQTILSGTEAGYYRQAGDEFTILVKLRNAEKSDLRDILDLTLTNSDGDPVVLRNVVDTVPRKGPVLIERKDQERIITVTGEVSGRDMGSVIGDVQDRLRSVPVPSGFTIGYGGDYEEQQESFRELLFSCILALVLVYMVMACQYESLRDPFVVMFSVPLAAIGVILMLFFTGTTFNIQSFIGCIMLGGIVVNNAILLVDHTNLLRRRDGMPIREAIEEAGRRRLRPILMTATTTIIGLVPLALGLGEGGEAQAPMARAVIGGLLSSTLITLVFVPVVYSLFERHAWRAEARRGE
ncbi:MAG: efflux RND transporter permease subunit [Sedimentisphaerales bacterium]|nr:efflux RND transporter permease subunit [Sedimentisphaerales bacterium]NLT75797.1 efflux RND transporter permease subunit [Planctomycetota bacterium]